jgi:hypothetical protein
MYINNNLDAYIVQNPAIVHCVQSCPNNNQQYSYLGDMGTQGTAPYSSFLVADIFCAPT